MDKHDFQILDLIEKDGRRSYAEIAKQLVISNTMVHQRITKMKQSGLLLGTTIKLDQRKLGFEWGAFTGLVLREDSDSKAIIEALKRIPEVTECYYIAGQYTLYIRIAAKNNEHMREILYDKIDRISEVIKTESMIDFGTAFRRNVPLK
jgi:Lrp/AsnC family transcriptional regulator for asnA, asnC and gidA